ncbi:MAG: hypothetical protein CVU40_17360 [Chloroflexi bacterium HGW-Chloroflexi-2]|jgi:dolichol-phosphate mannosyltransferase|nr:MAG: hypothetical protein CVU40_17360 [Chloroflexi bacterium HGW-Chloroflexi-2]
MKNIKGLIFIPTYNEYENVENLIIQLENLNLGFDFLFIDDNSPDKTGALLDNLAKSKKNMYVLHRPRKMGIGSAHVDGIHWAYDNKYQVLITMDSDFSHSPVYIHELLKNYHNVDVIVGSRYLNKSSLSEWNFKRKFLTNSGHFLTKLIFKMPFDATGAFRLYNLETIPIECFSKERSTGYSFFFESIFILFKNNFKIKEIAINLPARTYGQSKMKFGDAVNSLILLVKMGFLNVLSPSVYLIKRKSANIISNSEVIDDQGWEEYWKKQLNVINWLYDRIAETYRKLFIKPNLKNQVKKNFKSNALLLHAGCGSGLVDKGLSDEYSVIALDISLNALSIYGKNHPNVYKLIQNDIRNIDLENQSIDGIYSLGVMEHFEKKDIIRILNEFNRILKPSGRLILFWPPKFGLSVFVLKVWHIVLNKIYKKDIKLHPDEVSLLESKDQIIKFADLTGFSLINYCFGVKDLFTQVIIILEKKK